MTQREKREFLIQKLIDEQPRYRDLKLLSSEAEQKMLLRTLMNVRPALPAGEDFLTVQDAYLREETARKGVTDIADLMSVEPGIYLWQGDITTLKCGAIVNAVNSGMTGCLLPAIAPVLRWHSRTESGVWRSAVFSPGNFTSRSMTICCRWFVPRTIL